MLILVCPTCRALVVFPNHQRGTQGRCPACTRPIGVPLEGPSDSELEDLLRRYRLSGDLEADEPSKLGSDPDGKQPSG